MKKILMSLLVVILTIGLFAGCSNKDETTPTDSTKDTSKETNDTKEPAEEAPTFEDGIYMASEDNFSEKSGWKYFVTLEVKDGKIVSVDWNGAHVSAGPDKKTLSKDGKYVLANDGGSAWHEQAAVAEQFLIESQDPTAISFSDEAGHSDDIASVSVTVAPLFKLAEQALNNGPVGYGKWADGQFHAEEPAFNEKNGWKYTFDATVISGYIVSVNWNGAHKDGGDDKKTLSVNGGYVLANDGGAAWHEQAAIAEAHLLETQDPTAITYSDDAGHTDDLSGVSIYVAGLYGLAEEALQSR